ncbi:cation transporter [Acerihabitans sp. KWT182]|uniref:Cation transporter n=1 Tax=Acerihabitans sp. KWT182 TaxID=3157919 RepID=A0AAU7Q8N8_9GAMM
MADCCEDKHCEIAALRLRHARVLWLVLTVNAAMFLAEGMAGWHARSTSLLADALDMLGDAMVYGFSLFVAARSARWQASAAAVKGALMLFFGLAVLWEAAEKIMFPVRPDGSIMALVGGVALAANLFCFGLLWRYRGDNLNMSSTWLCSRNDLFANLGVLLAAAAGYAFDSRWPDIMVGVPIAGLFLASAVTVLRRSRQALRAGGGRSR